MTNERIKIEVFGSIYPPESIMGTPDQAEVESFLNSIGRKQIISILAVGQREVWVIYVESDTPGLI